MTQYRVSHNICQCHPETCTHWRYQVEILVDGHWTGTDIRGDFVHCVKMKVEQKHTDWRLYEPT